MNIEEQEIVPRPQEHGRCLAENLVQVHAWAESEYWTAQSTKDTE